MKFKTMILPLLSAVACSGPVSTSTAPEVTLTDADASAATKAMYAKLTSLAQKGYMIGHQDALAYGHDWYGAADTSDIESVTGQLPAIYGWEVADLELGAKYNLDSVYFDDIRKYIQLVNRRGGINTISWHINNIVTGENAWDTSSKEVVKSVLAGGQNHEKFMQWLDAFAQYVSTLTDDNGELIPIVFRPYHELRGSWFWWGNDLCTADEYKQLWKQTADYLVKTKGLHNLLFCFSTNEVYDEASFLERYPGDDYVDVIGFDIYQYGEDLAEAKTRYIDQLTKQCKVLQAYSAKSGKPWAVTETGLESVADSVWFTTAIDSVLKDSGTSYVMFWRNAFNKPEHYYVPFKGHKSEADFKTFVGLPHVLMLNDIAEGK